MRAVFIGCVSFSQTCLKHLLIRDDIDIAGVVTRSRSDFNADFCDLSPLAASQAIPTLTLERNDPEQIHRWITDLRPDVVFCLGWSWLLPERILNLSPRGVVGYHPAPLPRGRGRHPIIWALALGLEETGSTFFIMDGGADSGPIISQAPVAIEPQDDAGSLYRKIETTALEQLDRLIPDMVAGRLRAQPQDETNANYWRKRSSEDGQIDWRMSAHCVHNLVRALAPPYPGAEYRETGSSAKVWKTRIVTDIPGDTEPGKVLACRGRNFVVKCGEDAVELLEHGFDPIPETGSYL